MTEFQKKKLVDLGLVLFGIVLVGLFLRSQLLNPIILPAEERKEAPILSEQERYIIKTPYVEEAELDVDGFTDVIGIEFTQDAQFIDIYVTVREMPETLNLIENTYAFLVYLDANGDDDLKDDVLVKLQSAELANAEARLEDVETFTVALHQMDGQDETYLAQGEWALADEKILIRVPFSKKLDVDAKTPVKVEVLHRIQDKESTDTLPNKK